MRVPACESWSRLRGHAFGGEQDAGFWIRCVSEILSPLDFVTRAASNAISCDADASFQRGGRNSTAIRNDSLVMRIASAVIPGNSSHAIRLDWLVEIRIYRRRTRVISQSIYTLF